MLVGVSVGVFVGVGVLVGLGVSEGLIVFVGWGVLEGLVVSEGWTVAVMFSPMALAHASSIKVEEANAVNSRNRLRCNLFKFVIQPRWSQAQTVSSLLLRGFPQAFHPPGGTGVRPLLDFFFFLGWIKLTDFTLSHIIKGGGQ